MRYEVLLVSGFILIILSLTLTGEYSGVYTITAQSLFVYQIISISISCIALLFTLFGLFSSNKRWIKKRGTDNLNSFKRLAFFAYVRHPITFSCILVSISIMLLIQSILSNVLAGLAIIIFTISSFEKDTFFQKIYGYPYKVYSRRVPRFNIIHGVIRSFIIGERSRGSDDDILIYD